MERLSGCWFKLASKDGKYLGLLNVPDRHARDIERSDGRVWTRIYKDPPMPVFLPRDSGRDSVALVWFDIAPSHDVAGAIVLFGIEPEDIHHVRGFAFLPSVEYLHRPARKTEASNGG